MIIRLGLSLLFAVFGVASFFVFGVIEARLCEIFPIFQHCLSKIGNCGLDCSQTWSFSKSVSAFLFFFGPSIVFAIIAFVFSKKSHRFIYWVKLLFFLIMVYLIFLLFII